MWKNFNGSKKNNLNELQNIRDANHSLRQQIEQSLKAFDLFGMT